MKSSSIRLYDIIPVFWLLQVRPPSTLFQWQFCRWTGINWLCLQCFDTVSLAPGRALKLKIKLQGAGMFISLEQGVSEKLKWFYLSSACLYRLPGKDAIKWVWLL